MPIKLTATTRGPLLALLAIGLAACSGAGHPSGDDGDDDGDDDGNHHTGQGVLQALKLDLVGLIAGDYTETCTKMIGDELQPVGSGSTFSISNAGQASWGFGSIDMIGTPSQDFGVLVSDSLAGSRFDLLDPVSQDRLAIIGVTVTTDGYVAATVTDDRPSPALSDLCSTTKPSALVGADAWQLMNDYISVPTTRLHCIDLSTAAQFDRDFSFSSTEIVLGSLVIHAGDARASEQVYLSEFDPKPGFTYTLTTADQQTLLVEMTPTKQLTTVELISPEAKIIGCMP